jgi:CRISPR-associated protein Csh2
MSISNRSEILFLYDVNYANPNGDPLDANKPRIDEETGRNIVTDVRLKRTVRDYLHQVKGEEIFVREIADDNDVIQDAKLRAEDFLLQEGIKLNKSKLGNFKEMKDIIQNNLLSDCIDVRLFGATIPLEKSAKEKGSITFTGPVQFKMGRSLHRVKLQYIKGTGAFAADENKTQKTFREEYVLPYSLIAFHGIVNENAAKHTGLTEDDVSKLLEALWAGTRNLISRSKAMHNPRLLLRVAYSEPCFHMGELDKLVSAEYKVEDEALRDIDEIILNVEPLIKALVDNSEKIAYVQYFIADAVRTSTNFAEELSALGIKTEAMSF